MQFIIIIIFFVFLSFGNIAFSKGAYPFDHSKIKVVMSSTGEANDLLNALKWNLAYDKKRTQEIKALLKSVDGEALKGLTDEQKNQVLISMQDMAIKQIIDDREYFRRYLISQYVEFFTPDELVSLTKYYNTDMMQMVLNIKLEGKAVDIAKIKAELADIKPQEKKNIENVESSYLYTRYLRFQEKVKPKLDRMIVDRLKEVFGFVINEIPEIVDHVKNKAPSSNIIIQDVPSIKQ